MRRTQLPGSWIWTAVLTVLVLLCSVPMMGQAGTLGTMTGIVNDPSGAVVPDATVTIKDKSTNQTLTQATNSAGRYTFVNLRPGDYEVTITKTGFAKAVIASDIIQVGETSTNNVTLRVGGENQTVEVAGSGVELQTLNATVGNVVNGLSLESLPTIQRDTSTFLTLQGGISPDGSVAGAVVDQSSFQLDGGNNTNDMDGSMSVYTTSFAGDPTGGISNQSNGVASGPTGVMPTPADSVEEFKVNSTGQTADFNSSAGAEVQVVTRRGTSSYHGSAYEYYLDNNWSANTWDNNLTGTPVPNWHRSRFGARFGGPLLPKLLGGKTYFFANYEGYRWPNSETYERVTPSADMRLGLLRFTDGTTGVSTIYNLNNTTVTSAEGEVVPANSGCGAFPGSKCDPRAVGINPLVQQLWTKYMPLPNEVNGDCGLTRCDMSGGVGNIGGY